jgi:hypothetical protein
LAVLLVWWASSDDQSGWTGYPAFSTQGPHSRWDAVIGIGTLATAFGTVLLGAATFALGKRTGDAVKAAADQLEITQDGLALATAQLGVAREALDAQTQPFITLGGTSAELLNDRTVHVRNAGSGTAIIKYAYLLIGPDPIVAVAVEPAVAPGESTSITLPPIPDANRDTFDVAVVYADVSGRERGATRLTIQRDDDPRGVNPGWFVRQVFWDDTLEAVRENPRIGTQPRDLTRRRFV